MTTSKAVTKNKSVKRKAVKRQAAPKRVTAKKAKTERELAEARVRELQEQLAAEARLAEQLAEKEYEQKLKSKKVYALVQGAYYFSALVPVPDKVDMYQDENGDWVTDWDVMDIGQEAFRMVFDEGGDEPFKIHGIMTEGTFDASDYDNYELYLDKDMTKLVRWHDYD